MTKDLPRQYAVSFEIWGREDEFVVTATSRSSARYLAWLEVSEPTGISFGEFARTCVSSIRLSSRRTRYDYVREFYGLNVATGDQVCCRGAIRGVVAEPPNSNPRTNYVYVIVDGGHARPWHAQDVCRI